MSGYVALKYLHIAALTLSVALFLLRAGWAVRGSTRLERRWVRVVPHAVDSVLLASGVALMVTLRAWPSEQPWLAAKLAGLLVYIALGSVAIKRGRTPRLRALAALGAVLVFAYIVGAALNHDPASWLARP